MDETPTTSQRSADSLLFRLLCGIAISLTSSAIASFGINLQAHALRARPVPTPVVESSATSSASLLSPRYIDDEETDVGSRHRRLIGGLSNSSAPKSILPTSPTSDTKITMKSPTPSMQNSESSLTFRKKSSTPLLQFTQIHRSHKFNTLRRMLFNQRWYVGFGLYILSQAFGSALALQLLPTVLVAPLTSASLFFNALFSRVMLGTSIKRIDWVGTGLVVCGAVLVSIFGTKTSVEHQNLWALIETFSRPVFITYFAMQTLMIVGIVLTITYLSRRYHRIRLPSPVSPRGRSGISMFRLPLVLACLHSGLGGLLASQNILVAKAVTGLLAHSPRDLGHPLPLFMIYCLIQDIMGDLYTLNAALYYAPNKTVLTIPVFSTVFNCSALINSMVYWEEFGYWRENPSRLVAVIAGVLFNVCGVLLLSVSAGSNTSVLKVHMTKGSLGDDQALLLVNGDRRVSSNAGEYSDNDDQDDDRTGAFEQKPLLRFGRPSLRVSIPSAIMAS